MTNYFFRTLDGFSVAFLYNPYCATDKKDKYIYTNGLTGANALYIQETLDTLCMMGVYDMNGKKGPNRVGFDIGFVGSFYNGFETRTAAALPYTQRKDASGLKGSTTWQKLYDYCDTLGKDKEWIMPDIDEMSLLYAAIGLVAYPDYDINNTNLNYFTRTNYMFLNPRKNAWGLRSFANKNATDNYYVHCVRRTQLK